MSQLQFMNGHILPLYISLSLHCMVATYTTMGSYTYIYISLSLHCMVASYTTMGSYTYIYMVIYHENGFLDDKFFHKLISVGICLYRCVSTMASWGTSPLTCVRSKLRLLQPIEANTSKIMPIYKTRFPCPD